MWTERFEYMLMLAVMAALLRTSYELTRQPQDGHLQNLPQVKKADSVLAPWQHEASARAVERYAEAQDKKWRNWNDAMFERSA